MMIMRAVAIAGWLAMGAVASGRYCDEQLGLCFEQFSTSTPSGIYFRVAVPPNAVAPFDIALQVVAPIGVGWAGIAWGGKMVYNPLTVVWPDGDAITLSSRVATLHNLPQMNPRATLIPLKGSAVNETHWTANVLCQGCSSWVDTYGPKTLDTQNEVARFGWAMAVAAPDRPEDPTSPFHHHDYRGSFLLSLKQAQQEGFNAAIAAARG